MMNHTSCINIHNDNLREQIKLQIPNTFKVNNFKRLMANNYRYINIF